MEKLSVIKNIICSEPLLSFVFKTSAPFNENLASRYAIFVHRNFGAFSCSFSYPSTKFCCPFSSAAKGLFQLGQDFLIAGDPLKKGTIYIPKPGENIWSGRKFSFKTKQELLEVARNTQNEVEKLITAPFTDLLYFAGDKAKSLHYQNDTKEVKEEEKKKEEHGQAVRLKGFESARGKATIDKYYMDQDDQATIDLICGVVPQIPQHKVKSIQGKGVWE